MKITDLTVENLNKIQNYVKESLSRLCVNVNEVTLSDNKLTTDDFDITPRLFQRCNIIGWIYSEMEGEFVKFTVDLHYRWTLFNNMGTNGASLGTLSFLVKDDEKQFIIFKGLNL